MRIGIVCPYSWDVPGGVQFHIRDLAEHLIRRGHEVSVLAPADDGTRLPPFVVSAGRAVPVPYNGSVARLNFGFLSAARVRRWLHEGDFDVIHIHEPTSPSLGLLACWAAQGPIVATFHTSNPRSRAMIAAYPILQPALEKISARIAVSEYARRTLVEHLGGDAVVIPNGVDVDFFARAEPRPEWTGVGTTAHDRTGGNPAPAAHPAPGAQASGAAESAVPEPGPGRPGEPRSGDPRPRVASEDLAAAVAPQGAGDPGPDSLPAGASADPARPATIGFIGRIDEPRKGLPVLMRALPKILAERPGTRLLVAGRGDEEEAVAALPREARDAVEFLGMVSDEDKARLLRSVDLYVAPNTGGESFGIILVEAMSAGAPVLASDLDAFAQVLDRGAAGELFANEDADALAAAAVRLLADPARRAELSERGSRHVRRFDWATVGADILAVYETVTAGAASVATDERTGLRARLGLARD
ncbi:glycosyltransferase family 4 protein [Streptomyces huiliensis]|uniref:glycosyltransferase family 4 protein n=1 Tax=Streptomyces huiliensis TaxID=2876027 RepID=UPI001CBC2E91|nr:glycosyltransferase family 4 protein [Streptomyces huiliensis]MBZ4321872.1 glycosyltransferase family 4 protein [Streptomyces huiliensis]